MFSGFRIIKYAIMAMVTMVITPMTRAKAHIQKRHLSAFSSSVSWIVLTTVPAQDEAFIVGIAVVYSWNLRPSFFSL
jgi:hypothetical protein